MKLYIGAEYSEKGYGTDTCLDAALWIRDQKIIVQTSFDKMHPRDIYRCLDAVAIAGRKNNVETILVTYNAYAIDYLTSGNLDHVSYYYEDRDEYVPIMSIPRVSKLLSYGDMSEIVALDKIDDFIKLGEEEIWKK